MKRMMILLVGIVAVGLAGLVVGLAQPGGTMGGGMMGPGMTGGHGSMPRHFDYMHGGLPDAYRGKTSPLGSTVPVLMKGRLLYGRNCSSCHGPTGRGDGPAAAGLNPQPANLAWTMGMPVSRDDFLYWTISEGGAKYGSAMPAFKSTLKPDEIWSIIAALRSGDLRVAK